MPINSNTLSYYTILKINPDASIEQIKKAYHRLALIHHPDKHIDPAAKSKAEAKFKKISEAYETLKDPEQRVRYDRMQKWKSDVSWTTPSQEEFKEPTRVSKGIPLFEAGSLYGYSELEDLIKADDDNLPSDIEKKCIVNYSELLKTLLYQACVKGKLPLVKFLIEKKGINPKFVINDVNGMFTGSLFTAAAGSGNLELVKYLLEKHDADISLLETKKTSIAPVEHTALSKAAQKGHISIVNYLIEMKADVNPMIYGYIIKRPDLLEIAVSSGKAAIVKALIQAGTQFKKEHFDQAIRQGHFEIAEFFKKLKPGLGDISNLRRWSTFENPSNQDGTLSSDLDQEMGMKYKSRASL